MKIENYREVVPGHPVVAEFDLYLPSIQMTIHNCKIVRSKKGHLFYTFPSYQKVHDDGRKTYHPVITFSLEKKEQFDKVLYEELEPFIKNR